MTKLHDMRAELRALRKESVKPVSRMKKDDIAVELQRLKGIREETPAVASTPSAPVKKSKSAVESIKEAKKAEFPVMPSDSGTKKKSVKSAPGSVKSSAPAEGDKKKSKLAKLMALMEGMSSDEE
jgi:hypothetical protein